jgi:hypothetical protein
MAKAKIPAGVTPEHFLEIDNFLNQFLSDVKRIARATRPMWASCRLNESRQDISPVFIGWVEDDAFRELRLKKNEAHPGLFRFGDDHYSEIYEDCVKQPGVIKKRDWSDDLGHPVRGQWMVNARKLSVGMGVMHRRSIAIKIGKHAVGTINVGFQANPGKADRAIARVMKNWSHQDSPFITYLRDNFELGGPAV